MTATSVADSHFANYFSSRPAPSLDVRFKHYHVYDYVNNTPVSPGVLGALAVVPGPISYIPPEGIVLSSPGTYYLAGDIVWTPASSGASAITVQANGVVLDFGGHRLKCNGGGVGGVGGLAGVYANVVLGLTVKNGCLSGFDLYGVFCTGVSDLVVSGLKVTCLRNDDPSKTPMGILCAACVGVEITGCYVGGINVKGPGFTAIQMLAVIGCIVTDCVVKNIKNGTGGCAGISHAYCLGVEVRRCVLSGISSCPVENLLAIGHTTIGILPTYCDGILIEGCSVSDVRGSCDDAHGISVFVCLNAEVRGCKVRGVTTGGWGADGAGVSAKTTGIEIYCDACLVTGCRVEDITAVNPGDRQCTGFSDAAAKNVVFTDCVVRGVLVSLGPGRGVGFGWAPDMRPQFAQPAVESRFIRCKAISCQVGFDTWYHIDGVWTDITAIDCCIPVLRKCGGCRVITCNQCSECPGPGTTTVVLHNLAKNNVIRGLTVKCEYLERCRGSNGVLRRLRFC